MLRITFLMLFVLAGTWGNAGLLLAQTHVVVGAGVAEEPRTGNQFELALAAAAGIDEANRAIAGGLIHVKFMSSTDGIESIKAEVERVDIFIEDGIPLRAELACTAEVKLRSGRRFLGVAGTIDVSDMREWSLYFPETMLQPIQDAAVFSGGSSIELWEDPVLLFNAVGEGSTVPSIYQAAGAISADGRAIGHLSLLANRDNGDLVRVEGAVDGAAVGFYVGRRRLQLHLSGVAAVDVFRPDNTSPDTCFGDFTFVGNEGPHGPFRIDAPECRDPLAGIEGSDIGTGPAEMATASWPRP
jgi:hypothetical protein